MTEPILQILQKLPLDVLISLVSIVVVIGAIVLIPFWVRRVEARMQEIHRVNNTLTEYGLKFTRHSRRLDRLEDSGDVYESRFEKLGLSVERLETKMDNLKEGQDRIM